jgi:pimeloyl-ACP methyl ester carboxylesterase
MDLTVRSSGGRVIGAADYGPPAATAVLWCHGGPGSRFEPRWLQHEAAEAGLRIVAIDRPGYGLSSPRPGRTIADVVPDLLQVADHLGIEEFLSVGVSTGGAYALAVAALAPHRVLGVVACCAVTDMRWGPARATMHTPHVQAVWDASDRDAAIAAAVDAYGEGFTKQLGGGMTAVLARSDAELFADPAWMGPAMAGFAAMSTHGLQGYADDRLADGPGWVSFDVNKVACPVTVLHGDHDLLCDLVHAEHTAEVVPNAELVVIADAAHFSIAGYVVPHLVRLRESAPPLHDARPARHRLAP